MFTSDTSDGRAGGPVAQVEPLRLFVLDDALVLRVREVPIAIWSLLSFGGVLSLILVHAVGTELARDGGGFLSLGSELAPGTWVASTMLGNPSGVLTFAWIVPAMAFGIAFLVEHLRRVLADPDVVLQPGRRTLG